MFISHWVSMAYICCTKPSIQHAKDDKTECPLRGVGSISIKLSTHNSTSIIKLIWGSKHGDCDGYDNSRPAIHNKTSEFLNHPAY